MKEDYSSMTCLIRSCESGQSRLVIAGALVGIDSSLDVDPGIFSPRAFIFGFDQCSPDGLGCGELGRKFGPCGTAYIGDGVKPP